MRVSGGEGTQNLSIIAIFKKLQISLSPHLKLHLRCVCTCINVVCLHFRALFITLFKHLNFVDSRGMTILYVNFCVHEFMCIPQVVTELPWSCANCC